MRPYQVHDSSSNDGDANVGTDALIPTPDLDLWTPLAELLVPFVLIVTGNQI
ncbi:MAG: hypothetical protein IPH36_15965 [Saprospiraceae bacterium]|nr:hypothetical protein [Saprospiraceae bacterium]